MSAYPSTLVPVDHVEPVPRRIRATLAGRVVLDTTKALYVWESPSYPQYYIPVTDVDPAALVREDRVQRLKRGTANPVSLRVGNTIRQAGRVYTESSIPGLSGMARFDWDALDAWFEEDEQVYVHPRSPYARVDALRSSRTVRVELDGVVLAESRAPVLVFETGLPTRHYLDRTALNLDYLRPSDTVTACPYKGRTSGYWSAHIGDRTYQDIAWTYAFPTTALLPIAGLVAFYDEKVDTFIDDELQERPVNPFS